MARLFNSGSESYSTAEAVPFTAVPLTLACWFYASNVTETTTIMGVGGGATTTGWYIDNLGTIAGDPIRAGCADAGSHGFVNCSAGYTANTWYHATAVFPANNSRSIYLNGGDKTTNTTAKTPDPGSIVRCRLGAIFTTTASRFFSGRIAEAGVWKVALSDAEVARLAKGVLPIHIQPESLVCYWPLWGIHSPEVDLHSRTVHATDFELTLTNSPTAANHAPVVPFSKQLWTSCDVVAAAGQPMAKRWGGVKFASIGGKNVW